MIKKLLLILVLSGTFIAGCRKEYNYYSTVMNSEKDSLVMITYPHDSTVVIDSVQLHFRVDSSLHVIRTELYTDFQFTRGYDKVPSAIWFSAAGLAIGTSHYVSLKVRTWDGKEYNSNVILLLIHYLSKPILNLTVSVAQKSSVGLDWYDNSCKITGYHILRKEGGGEFLTIADIPGSITFYTDATIDTTKSYTYEVEGYYETETSLSNPKGIAFITDKYIFYTSFTSGSQQPGDGKIVLTPDAGKALMTNYYNGNVYMVDLATGHRNTIPWSYGTLGLTMSHSGNIFAVGGSASENYEKVEIWDLNSLSLILTIPAGVATWELAFNQTDDQLMVGGSPIRLFTIPGGDLVKSVGGSGAFIRGMQYSRDGTKLLTGGNNDTVDLWDIPTATLVRSYSGNGGHVGAVAFNPDETQLITGSYEDTTLIIFDKISGGILKSIHVGQDIHSIRVKSNGEIIVGCNGGKVIVLSPDGQIIQTYNGSGLYSLDYNESHDLIATYGDGNVTLLKKIGHWEITTK
ncbi:MAG: hypothetical protein NTX61_18175 [Bacteroidetes bacterium]|nr:hypothetical protein [Bacteroidota bacterium]